MEVSRLYFVNQLEGSLLGCNVFNCGLQSNDDFDCWPAIKLERNITGTAPKALSRAMQYVANGMLDQCSSECLAVVFQDTFS